MADVAACETVLYHASIRNTGEDDELYSFIAPVFVSMFDSHIRRKRLAETLAHLGHLLAPVALGPTALLFALLTFGDKMHFVAVNFRDALGDDALIKASNELIYRFSIASFNLHMITTDERAPVVQPRGSCVSGSPPSHRLCWRRLPQAARRAGGSHSYMR